MDMHESVCKYVCMYVCISMYVLDIILCMCSVTKASQ